MGSLFFTTPEYIFSPLIRRTVILLPDDFETMDAKAKKRAVVNSVAENCDIVSLFSNLSIDKEEISNRNKKAAKKRLEKNNDILLTKKNS